MKNKFIIFFALIVAAAAAGGQSLPYTTVLLETNPLANGGGNIRSWTPTKAVIYHEQFVSAANRTGIFSIMGAGSTTMQSVKFPNGFYAHDFQILGDTLYFGGTIANGNDGVLGFFSLTDLENGTLHNVTYYTDNIVQQVKKLVAYRIDNGTGVGVAAVGWLEQQSSTGRYGVSYAIELRIRSGIHDCQYKESFSHNIGLEGESLDDVVVTDDYVAFVGDSASSELWIRRGDRNNFLLDLRFENRYRYYSVPICSLNRALAASMNGNNIAVVRNGDDGTGAKTAVFMLDLATMNMYEGQQFPCGEKDRCVDLEYMAYDNTLLLLMETYAGMQQNNRLILVKPGQPLPGIATSIYPTNGFQMGHIAIHDRRYVLAGSPNNWMVYRKSQFPASDQCINVAYRPIDWCDMSMHHDWYKSLIHGNLYINQMNVYTTTESYRATCIHQ